MLISVRFIDFSFNEFVSLRIFESEQTEKVLSELIQLDVDCIGVVVWGVFGVSHD
jgi:hypothetical protein